jgi:hypothetical protein
MVMRSICVFSALLGSSIAARLSRRDDCHAGFYTVNNERLVVQCDVDRPGTSSAHPELHT